MSKTKIEWTESTWNPVSGCDKISDGCKNCYAEKMAKRLQVIGTRGYENGFKVALHEDRLSEPLERKKPTMYFVCSMGDLFHEDVPFEFIDKVFAVVALTPHHTYQILTKRPERMKEYFLSFEKINNSEIISHFFGRDIKISCRGEYIAEYAIQLGGKHSSTTQISWTSPEEPAMLNLPLENVWLGVTAENQEQADKRIAFLLDTPAAKRFVSVEPMLGAIDLTFLHHDNISTHYLDALAGKVKNGWFFNCNKLDWVICGGETGTNARPMHPGWVRSLRDQCHEVKVPFFFKQWGEYDCNGNKVGKKQAGHLLDGEEYRDMPLASSFNAIDNN
ncbi:phage Gp37/Gp68 family protein [Aquamicrobium sp.]|uniref:phage Gp37/Gp68 family protein n=1 Tax=Aquamicrobium sp. TaxID=1872579 RepID=UPI00258BC79C|nr:phage Gp37/Gp68 family protein [Aquamicrobium sp.]MCK9549303.1 phage Gp37/Gp68 family protein [Aquamicrobium sp.]